MTAPSLVCGREEWEKWLTSNSLLKWKYSQSKTHTLHSFLSLKVHALVMVATTTATCDFRFRHPNLLTLLGYSVDGEVPYLVYEFLSNGTLEDAIEYKVKLQCISKSNCMVQQCNAFSTCVLCVLRL